MKKSITCVAIAAGLLSLETSPEAAVRLLIPSEDPGPPFIAVTDRPPVGEVFQDGEWAAIPFLRDPDCALANPRLAGSNLLGGIEPSTFACPLTVHGFAIYKNGPYPIHPVPVYAFLLSNGAVPIWF